MQVRWTRGSRALTLGPPRPGRQTLGSLWPGRQTLVPLPSSRPTLGSLRPGRQTLGPLPSSWPTLGPPRPARKAAGATRAAVVVIVGVLALVPTLAGCGAGGAPKAAASPEACGTGRTAANVPIEIEVNRGQVSCAVALTVEKNYAAAIVAGRAPGNGGGGPVTVSGWKCQGFPTPELLKTGDVSKCGKGGIEIVAILKS